MTVYVEDGLAGVLRAAAEFGKIDGVDPSRVFTDETAVAEWEGEDKIYVARGERSPIYDVTSPTGNSHAAIGEFALVTLSGSRHLAQKTAASVWDAVGWKFRDESWAAECGGSESNLYVGSADEYHLGEDDFWNLGDGSESVDLDGELVRGDSLFRVGPDDEIHLGADDRWKAAAFDFAGAADGDGIWIGGVLWTLDPETVRFQTSRLGVVSWIYDRYNTVPRSDNGSYADEWFSTHTIKTVTLN